MKLIIDRFEEDMAICETFDQKKMNLPKSRFPSGCNEGDVVEFIDGTITLDVKATKERRAQMEKRFKNLFKKKG